MVAVPTGCVSFGLGIEDKSESLSLAFIDFTSIQYADIVVYDVRPVSSVSIVNVYYSALNTVSKNKNQ